MESSNIDVVITFIGALDKLLDFTKPGCEGYILISDLSSIHEKQLE